MSRILILFLIVFPESRSYIWYNFQDYGLVSGSIVRGSWSDFWCFLARKLNSDMISRFRMLYLACPWLLILCLILCSWYWCCSKTYSWYHVCVSDNLPRIPILVLLTFSVSWCCYWDLDLISDLIGMLLLFLILEIRSEIRSSARDKISNNIRTPEI